MHNNLLLQDKCHNLLSHIKNISIFAALFLLIIICSIWFWFNYSFGYNTGYLANYELVNGPISMAENSGQSSGLAFNSDLNQLFVIINDHKINILTAHGKYIRSVELLGFEDTEGLSYLGNNNFILVEEKRGLISWFAINQDTKLIEFDPKKSMRIFPQPIANVGLEGITYAQDIEQLFVVKERNPKKIYSIQWPIKNINQPLINIPWDAETTPWWSVRGFSGIHYHSQTGHLFILSRRSRRIIEYTLSGQEVGSFSLKTASANLQQKINKAEGIVIADDGTLYICGEPNELYIFKKAP